MNKKNMGRAIIVLVGMVFLALVLGARPQPTLVSPTHLGVRPSDIVTLRGEYDGSTAKFVTVFKDGSTEDFSLPESKALVVTDVEYTFTQQFGIKVNGERVYIGPGNVRDHLAAGFVVSAPGLLEIEAPQFTGYVILRGYFTDDQ